jgi:hypothetical protein
VIEQPLRFEPFDPAGGGRKAPKESSTSGRDTLRAAVVRTALPPPPPIRTKLPEIQKGQGKTRGAAAWRGVIKNAQ